MEEQTEQIVETIKELGTVEVPVLTQSKYHFISIIGQIEGHTVLPPQNKATKYEHIIPQVIAIEQNDDIEGFMVIMNTMGGDVEAGLAIAEMIATMRKPSVSLVLGGGHSIGVPLAVSARHSFICSSATMTLHPIRMNGIVVNVPQTYEYFDKMQERLHTFIVEHSRIERETLNRLMNNNEGPFSDVGTVLVGPQAVECGLIDEVGGMMQALDKLEELKCSTTE
jgi:ATP-dependent protease ClpP protease subunit